MKCEGCDEGKKVVKVVNLKSGHILPLCDDCEDLFKEVEEFDFKDIDDEE